MNIICPKCAAGDIGRCELHIKKDHAGAVADAIREAAGLFAVEKSVRKIVCPKCGGDNTTVHDTDDLGDGGVDFYSCDDCGYKDGQAFYVTIYTRVE